MEKKSFFKQNFNYPIFLLILVSFANISKIIECVATILRFPTLIFATVMNIIVLCMPVVIAILLWIHKKKDMKNISVFIASTFSIITLIQVYFLFRRLVGISSWSFEEINFITWILSDLLGYIFSIIIYSILVINLITKRNKYRAFHIISVLYIIELCFFGIVRVYSANFGMGMMSNALSYFIQVLYVIAVWYVPSAIDKSERAEVSSEKIGVLIFIAVVTFVLYLSGILFSGGSSGKNNMNGWGNYDSNHNGVIDDDEFMNGWNDYIDDFLN